MKKSLIALAVMALAGSAFACGPSCSTAVTGSQSASVKGTTSNQISTYATAGGSGNSFGTSTSVANSWAVSGGAAGGVQGTVSGGVSIPVVGTVSGTATGAVIGGAQTTSVGGYASNVSVGSGSGFGLSLGSATAEVSASANGSITRDATGTANDGSAKYSISGKSNSFANGGIFAGTNSKGDYEASNVSGFAGLGGVALDNCDSNVNFAVGAVADVKGSVSYVKASSTGANAEVGAEAGANTFFEGSYSAKSDKALVSNVVPTNPEKDKKDDKKGNNGWGNGGKDGSPNGKDDNGR